MGPMHGIRRTAFAAAMAGSVAWVAPAAAEPALFVARDADSTVYMLGTVHVLRPHDEWRYPAIDAALAEADALWLEVDLAKEAGGAFFGMLRHGTSPDRPLSTRLGAEDRERLAAAAATVGIDPKTLEGLRPWFAAVTLSMKMAEKAGLTQQGVEMHLLTDAALRNLEVRAFETGDEQLRMFADLSEEDELQLLRETMREIADGPAIFAEMIDSWKAGDTDTLGDLVGESLTASGAAVYAAVVVDRNRRFADRIAEEMKGSGTHFVAIGAAHLAGPDSVQRFLAEKGIATERVSGGE